MTSPGHCPVTSLCRPDLISATAACSLDAFHVYWIYDEMPLDMLHHIVAMQVLVCWSIRPLSFFLFSFPLAAQLAIFVGGRLHYTS